MYIVDDDLGVKIQIFYIFQIFAREIHCRRDNSNWLENKVSYLCKLNLSGIKQDWNCFLKSKTARYLRIISVTFALLTDM